MATKLTKKQKEFADNYLDTGNGTQAVLDSSYEATNENSAGVEAYRTLRKAKVQEYIESNAEGASSRIVEISKEAKNEATKLNANKDILDRAGFKVIEKPIPPNILIVSIDPTNPEVLEALKTINKQRANEQ